MNSQPFNNLSVIIDWLQFTITENNITVDNIITLLKLDVNNFITLDHGKMGYKQQKTYNDISILYEGNKGMGIHVIFTGQACRYYETEHNLIELIQRINESKGKLTRIDLAMDDRTGDVIPFKQLIKDITNANIVSKWKSNVEIIKRSNKDAEIKGHTISLGSRSSRLFMRIYDKALEQKIEGIWNRIELEIKKEYAEQVQKIITKDNVGELMAKIINNYIRIVKPNPNDSNKSRWETKPYWEKLIATTGKQSLTVAPEEKTIDDMKEWISKQIAPSLALITINDEGSIDFIVDQVVQGKKRLKKKHLKKLKRRD